MSFSLNIKDEIFRYNECKNKAEKNAEISAILNMCGHIHVNQDKVRFSINTENSYVARKFFTLIKETYNKSVEVMIRRSLQLNKNRVYILYVTDEDLVRDIIEDTSIFNKNKIKSDIYDNVELKRAYIRGVFLCAGSMSDPEKGYHIEFVDKDINHLNEFKKIINSFGLDSKIILRKSNFVLYLKEAEQIVTLLNIMNAHTSLMDFENIRIIKDMRNNVNRIVNCETANLNKTVMASIAQIDDIQFLDDKIGIDSLPDTLRDVAKARLEYPNVSLKELGELMEPEISKSAINHRIRKIHELAEEYK